MNKQATSKRHLILSAILICGSACVVAHRPLFSESAAIDPSTAVRVDRPDVSQVIYRPLDAEHQQVWLTFEAKAGFDLFVQLGVPALDRLKDYRPTMAVVGPGLEQADVPFDLPAGMGVVVFPTDTIQSPRFFHEHFTKTDSWILRSQTVKLPQDGRYYLVAFEPNARPGKLWLSLGTKERFSVMELLQFGAWRKIIQAFHEVGPSASVPEFPPPPDDGKDGSASSTAEVWLCVREGIKDLSAPDAEWAFVKKRLSGIKLYIDQLNQAPPDLLAAIVRLVNENGFQVAVELGGCLDFSPMDETAGKWSVHHELAKLKKFYDAGGRVDFLDVDGPIRRLLYPEHRQDDKRFESIDKAAEQLADALKVHHQAHPEIRFWLLTNFPNWGWRGDVSYHARGPTHQDYGDYYEVLRIVFEKLQASDLVLEGVTVDNPYDYLIGHYPSVNLKDPKSIDWLGRVRDYEDYARRHNLSYNLIANSERGGNRSDELFYCDTLKMVDDYLNAGGRPARWFVQSWYPYPKQMTPETSPYTMTALVKAVIETIEKTEQSTRSR